jgi:hypothetical protein
MSSMWSVVVFPNTSLDASVRGLGAVVGSIVSAPALMVVDTEKARRRDARARCIEGRI